MASTTHPYGPRSRTRPHDQERTRQPRVSRTKLPPHLLRRYGTRGAQPRANMALRVLVLSAVLLPMTLLLTGAAGGWSYYAQVAGQLRPRLDNLNGYVPFQTSRIFSRDGALLYEYVTEGRRDSVPLDAVSPLVIDATVAIEDKNFWTNNGVDYVGIARSAVLNAQAQTTVSGASTITQQFIKLVLLTQEEQQERVQRKLKEAILAQQLTENYSKQEILQLYLNEVNYGNRNYGIQAASKGFFGVGAKDLNLNQASLLAGLPQSPSVYNPQDHVDGDVLRGVQLKAGWLNPARPLPNGTTPPRARQIDVLRQMVANRMIKESEARETVAQDLVLKDTRDEENRQRKQQAPHFVDYVVEQLENDSELGPLLRDQGGLNITTTVDLRFQQVALEEAKRSVDELVKEQGNLNNAAVVLQQPGTGQILAMVGSIDYNLTKPTTTPGEEGNVVDGQVNVATRDRQPGSALKPFTYLAAMQAGKATPGTILWDIETRWPTHPDATVANINSCVPEGEHWYCPKNYDQLWHGPLRIREALANSLNMPALLAIQAVGVPQTIDLLHQMGITTLNDTERYGLAVTLGGGEVKLLDLTTAYNTLANDGQYIAPTVILKITDRNGAVVREAKPSGKQVVDAKLVALIRDYMSDNDARTPIFGPSSSLKLTRPAAVKTGTTNDYRDAWAMGFTPYVTVGVWTGNNNNERTNSVAGSTGGGIIWNRIMERIFKTPDLDKFLRGTDQKKLAFPPLASYGLVEQPICQIGGAFGPRSKEWFVPSMPKPQMTQGACYEQDSLRLPADSGAYVLTNNPYAQEKKLFSTTP